MIHSKYKSNGDGNTDQFSLIGRFVNRIRMVFVFLLLLGMSIVWFFANYYLKYEDQARFRDYLDVLTQSLSQPLTYFDLAGIDATLRSYTDFLDFEKVQVMDRYNYIQAEFSKNKVTRAPEYEKNVLSANGDIVGKISAWRNQSSTRPFGILIFLLAGTAQMLIIVILGSAIMHTILRRELIIPLSDFTSAIKNDSMDTQFTPPVSAMRRSELRSLVQAYQKVLSQAKTLLFERIELLKNITNENDARALQLHLFEEVLRQSKMALTYRNEEENPSHLFFGGWVRPEVESFISTITPDLESLHEVARDFGVDICGNVSDPNETTNGFEAHFESGEIWNIRVLNLFGDKLAIFASDETERKHIENALHQKNKLESLGGVASGVAHDFNNILAIVSSAIEQLKSDISDVDDVLEVTDAAVMRGAAIVKQLLQFVHIGKTANETCNLSQLLRMQKKTLAHLLGHRIHLNLDMSENVFVSAEASYLQTVFVNLIINSRDAIHPHSGTISIRMRTPTESELVKNILDLEYEYIAVEIMDTGVGIPKEAISRIFDPFFSTKPVGKGTGLGLSITYEFISRIGGAIYVSNTSPDGTTITLLFRRAKPSLPTAHANKKVGVDKLFGKSILIIDDEKSLIKFIKIYLAKRGMNVHSSHSFKEGQFAIENTDFDIVVSDMYMPDGTGMDILRSLTRKTPFVLMSGNFQLTRDASADDIFPPRADLLFIQKPFKLEELSTLIESVF